jgi:HEAT repeat protein
MTLSGPRFDEASAFMLLSHVRRDRERALDVLARTPVAATAYAVRDVLLFDRDAEVRARAARWFAEARAVAMAPALRDALHDEKPLVRHAAIRALAVLDDARSAPLLARMALEEPIWWVRRAAVIVLARVRGEAAIPTLLLALDDPFWRVRHAAVRVLLRVGQTREHVRDAILAADARGSARAQGALAYLRKRWSGAPAIGEAVTPTDTHAPYDPDPAVVTARLEAGAAASPAFLAECLGDSHEQLRSIAVKRLVAAPSARALELAMLWLEEPRIPHAAETVIALLDDLGDRATPLVERALAAPRATRLEGATAWAASYVALAEAWEHLPRLLDLARELHGPTPLARRAAIAALGAHAAKHDEPAVVSVLQAALADSDAGVVRAAAHALIAARGHLDSVLVVAALARAETDVLTRRALARVLDAIDPNALASLTEDADAEVRAVALVALSARGLLPASALHRARRDPDPWVRRAVLADDNALDVLVADADPALRRAAFGVAGDPLAAARLAWSSPDPFLRIHAAERLDARDPADLARLLRLSRDPSPAVRGAAGDALERHTALDSLLAAALGRETEDEVRMSAHTWLARRFDRAAIAHLEQALLATESAPVHALVQAMLAVARPDDVPALPVEARAASSVSPRPAIVVEAPRTLAGFSVSPLAISGAAELPVPVFFEAMDAGCNLFFWEPRYRSLGTALRERPAARVIAGSYEASAKGIVRDVERALSRLRRDAIDVFLLYWARSPARLEGEGVEALLRLKAQGKIRAAGFSTHDRALACDAIASSTPWDVAMVRHSAAHPGAEESVFPAARARGVSVLAFSTLSYGRLLGGPFTAADCYRYSASRPGVSACLSAPRHRRELVENLVVLAQPGLDDATVAALRAHGRRVHEANRDFGATIRRFPPTLAETRETARRPDVDDATDEIDLSVDPRFG